MNLTVRDVTIGYNEHTDGTIPVSLTIRRGKKVSTLCMQPISTVELLMTQQDALTLQALMCRKTSHQYLFSDATLVKNAVRYALHQENSLSALPSLRKEKSDITHMAAMKVPQITNYADDRSETRLDTLHRYLGYGRQLTTEGATAQDNTGHVLLNHTNEDAKHQKLFSLGVNEVELYKLIRQMNNEPPITLPHPSQ